MITTAIVYIHSWDRLGSLVVPLINVILSGAESKDTRSVLVILNTMISVGNAIPIAFIGSIFFGLIGIASIATNTTDIGSHSNESNHSRNSKYNICRISS
jgi:hypothetical protein